MVSFQLLTGDAHPSTIPVSTSCPLVKVAIRHRHGSPSWSHQQPLPPLHLIQRAKAESSQHQYQEGLTTGCWSDALVFGGGETMVVHHHPLSQPLKRKPTSYIFCSFCYRCLVSPTTWFCQIKISKAPIWPLNEQIAVELSSKLSIMQMSIPFRIPLGW